MTLTPSTMLELGTPAPDFHLLDVVSHQMISLETFASQKVLLVMFICRHCPFVRHIQYELARLGKDYGDKSVGMVAISANNASVHPQDSPESLREMAQALEFTFPLCYDESQETAKAYTAACTPDFFLFDASRKLVYRGQLDSSRPGNPIPVSGSDLRAAIEALLADKPVSKEQKPSIGCNIKWKPGKEPAYFTSASGWRGILQWLVEQLKPRFQFWKSN
jgi:peroxiredoxin